MTRTILRRVATGGIILLVMLLITWQIWWRAVPVTGWQVRPADLTVEVMATGTLAARVSNVVSSKIQGRIVEIDPDQGHQVQTGQILVRLDDTDLNHQVIVAEASVQMNRAALDRVEVERRRAQAFLTLARLEHERVLDMYSKGAASTSERDQAVERLEVAEAELARAEALIVEAQKTLVASQRALDQHRWQLDDTVIRSPLNGLVVRRDRDRGDVVVPGSPILRLVASDSLWISAWVDETAMGGLAVGQPARVVFRAEPERDYGGRVARLGREVDPELREFVVDVDVEELPAIWAVGQRAEVYIATDHVERTLTIPAEYLYVRDGATGVWLNVDGRAQWRPCDIGLRGRTMIEVTSGVEHGDIVLRPADARAERMLRAGRKVAQ